MNMCWWVTLNYNTWIIYRISNISWCVWKETCAYIQLFCAISLCLSASCQDFVCAYKRYALIIGSHLYLRFHCVYCYYTGVVQYCIIGIREVSIMYFLTIYIVSFLFFPHRVRTSTLLLRRSLILSLLLYSLRAQTSTPCHSSRMLYTMDWEQSRMQLRMVSIVGMRGMNCAVYYCQCFIIQVGPLRFFYWS